MYKSLIITITAAILSSVVYCQTNKPCNAATLEYCGRFCMKTNKRPTTCAAVGDLVECSVSTGPSSEDIDICAKVVDDECQTIFNAQAKISCSCLQGNPTCTVPI